MMGGLVMDYTEEEVRELFAELDKGIDDMEAGRLHTHEETRQYIMQQIEEFASKNPGIR